MSLTHIGRVVAAVAVAFGVATLAEAAGQGQAQSPAAQPSSGAAQKVTVVGCVVRETDYRKANDAGRGGVAGTGVGAGNEFVLTSASISSGEPAASPSPASGPGAAYELTGSNEGMAAQHVGRRVEITGMMKAAETSGGAPTGGPSAGRPPSGVDVASKDLKLREIEVTSIKEIGTTCPAV